ncbi:MAG: hypothetical protein V5A55_05020 [Halovenus sp.]
MVILLDAARGAALLNVLLLLILGTVWFRNYRQHGASHTLGLLVFAGFLFIQNILWLYLYILHPDFVGWFVNSSTDIQTGVALLCGLETGALVFLTRITWR